MTWMPGSKSKFGNWTDVKQLHQWKWCSYIGGNSNLNPFRHERCACVFTYEKMAMFTRQVVLYQWGTRACSFTGKAYVSTGRRGRDNVLQEGLRRYYEFHNYRLRVMKVESGWLRLLDNWLDSQPPLPDASSKEPDYSENFRDKSTFFEFDWYEPKYGDGGQLEHYDYVEVRSTELFRKGYKAIASYIAGDELDPHLSPAFLALERFWKEKGY